MRPGRRTPAPHRLPRGSWLLSRGCALVAKCGQMALFFFGRTRLEANVPKIVEKLWPPHLARRDAEVPERRGEDVELLHGLVRLGSVAICKKKHGPISMDEDEAHRTPGWLFGGPPRGAPTFFASPAASGTGTPELSREPVKISCSFLFFDSHLFCSPLYFKL